MSVPISISMQAGRLAKYGIDSSLKFDFKDIKLKCKEMSNNIKGDKAGLGALKKQYSSNKKDLASTKVEWSIRGLLKRRAKVKQLHAMKKLIKQKKYIIKNMKIQYKRLIERRKAIRAKIKSTYENHKDNIKDIRDDRRRERREKLKEKGIIIANAAQTIGEGIKNTADKVREKFTPEKGEER